MKWKWGCVSDNCWTDDAFVTDEGGHVLMLLQVKQFLLLAKAWQAWNFNLTTLDKELFWANTTTVLRHKICWINRNVWNIVKSQGVCIVAFLVTVNVFLWKYIGTSRCSLHRTHSLVIRWAFRKIEHDGQGRTTGIAANRIWPFLKRHCKGMWQYVTCEWMYYLTRSSSVSENFV